MKILKKKSRKNCWKYNKEVLMTCPDEECHKRVNGHHTSLFGEDGLGGIAGCIKKKISWKSAISVFAFILLLSGGFILYSMAGEKEQNATINKHEVQILSIKEDTIEIKETLKKQITLEQLKRVIKEAVNND